MAGCNYHSDNGNGGHVRCCKPVLKGSTFCLLHYIAVKFVQAKNRLVGKPRRPYYGKNNRD